MSNLPVMLDTVGLLFMLCGCVFREKEKRQGNLSHQRRFFYKLPKEQTEKLVRYNNLLYDLVLTVIGCVRKTFSFLARSRTNCFALLFEYTRSKKRFRSDDRSMVIRFIRLKNNISHSVMHRMPLEIPLSLVCVIPISLSITVVCKSG